MALPCRRMEHAAHNRPSLEARVAAELRAELARQGRSRRWLAEQTGQPLTTVARWVKGTTAPGLDELELMAEALGTTVVALLREAGRNTTPGVHRIAV